MEIKQIVLKGEGGGEVIIDLEKNLFSQEEGAKQVFSLVPGRSRQTNRDMYDWVNSLDEAPLRYVMDWNQYSEWRSGYEGWLPVPDKIPKDYKEEFVYQRSRLPVEEWKKIIDQTLSVKRLENDLPKLIAMFERDYNAL